ncbi:questin oxidase family protein [Phanerochaete sordida]|uniref:Questin oxidase family protein n=1 Tax=Phanerochaete sordida TaxID=48140 RepID=A0A9P3LIB5_9APHY|nr:questin oxidase family protein [Phanerochaete sordida]
MTVKLPPTLKKQGLVNFAGATPESKATIERLLEEDRQKHHCFWGRVGFHNHLSHHLLAAYDFGASAKQLQAIYDAELDELDPIHLADRATKTVEEQHVTITAENWTEYLGQEKYYACLVTFFAGVVEKVGMGEALEQYVFAPAANGNGAQMLLRFVGGAAHPLIQMGYAVEFGSDAMAAAALAQAACHSPYVPEIFDLRPQTKTTNGHTAQETAAGRQPAQGLSLLEIIREMYDSPIMKPVMPYDPDGLLRKRQADARTDGRPEEIVRLANLWVVDASRGQAGLDEKVEELVWLATLLMAGTSKPGRKPRVDFFLMHMVTSSLFVPSLLQALPSMASKVTLVRAMLPVVLMYVTVRGRPRIDPALLMSYSATPRPPTRQGLAACTRADGALGDPAQDAYVNPWPEIVAGVLHAPDAHTVKTIRTLYFAAQRYGTTPPGGAIGAFRRSDGKETHKGTAQMDGTIFVRAAGVVMNALGWVSHGQKEGKWDRSALGWDDAWNTPDE